jgi:hypothetical protein
MEVPHQAVNSYFLLRTLLKYTNYSGVERRSTGSYR